MTGAKRDQNETYLLNVFSKMNQQKAPVSVIAGDDLPQISYFTTMST